MHGSVVANRSGKFIGKVNKWLCNTIWVRENFWVQLDSTTYKTHSQPAGMWGCFVEFWRNRKRKTMLRRPISIIYSALASELELDFLWFSCYLLSHDKFCFSLFVVKRGTLISLSWWSAGFVIFVENKQTAICLVKYHQIQRCWMMGTIVRLRLSSILPDLISCRARWICQNWKWLNSRRFVYNLFAIRMRRRIMRTRNSVENENKFAKRLCDATQWIIE